MLLLLFAVHSRAETEAAAIARLAPKYAARQEVVVADARCDLVSRDEAIEVERLYPRKIWEAIGQATYYAHELRLRPAVIFLTRDNSTATTRLLERAKRICTRLGVRVYAEAELNPKVKGKPHA